MSTHASPSRPPVPPPIIRERGMPSAPPTVPVFMIPHGGVECPRCGYDLHGSVRAWTDHCPLEGNCPECGLAFRWSHVLVTAKFEPKWCIEFAIGWQKCLSACIKTWIIALIPWALWNSLHMSSAVRWRRLRTFVYMFLAIIALTYVAMQALRATLVYNTIRGGIQTDVMYAQREIDSAKARLAALGSGGNMLPWEFKAESDKCNQIIAKNTAIVQNPPVIDHSLVAAIGEAILMPEGDRSSGAILHANNNIVPYPAPVQYYNVLGSNAPRRYGWSIESVARSFGFSLVLVALLPATFVLLPASRRKAKVQWRHIGRIAIYSLSVPAIVCVWLVFFQGLNWIPATTQYVPSAVWAAPALMWFGMPLWWAAAIRQYLRMPHAEAVAVIMTIMILLMLGPMLLALRVTWLEQLLIAID